MADKTVPSHDPLLLTVLSILAEQSRHPYEVQRLIRERHKDFAIVPPRSLYHAVERLQQAGLVEPVEINRAGKRPERTIYRITAEGREDLQAWLTEMLSKPAEEYPAFMVALSLIGHLPRELVVRALQSRIALLEGKTAGLEVTVRGLKLQLPRLVLLELEYTLALHQGELDWLRSVIEDMRSGKISWDLGNLATDLASSKETRG